MLLYIIIYIIYIIYVATFAPIHKYIQTNIGVIFSTQLYTIHMYVCNISARIVLQAQGLIILHEFVCTFHTHIHTDPNMCSYLWSLCSCMCVGVYMCARVLKLINNELLCDEMHKSRIHKIQFLLIGNIKRHMLKEEYIHSSTAALKPHFKYCVYIATILDKYL